jgi:hypothetical protein
MRIDTRTRSLLTLSLLVCAQPALANWPADPVDGLPVVTGTGFQAIGRGISDGARGAILVFTDDGGNDDIYAQRVTEAGATAWAAGGVAVCTATGGQLSPLAVSDGANGVIVVWNDLRDGNFAVFAQRVDASGTVLWSADGVRVATSVGAKINPAAVADGAGGVIIAWQDYVGGGSDIYAQRLNAAGVLQWGVTGVPVCTATGEQAGPVLATDAGGGAYVAWYDARSANNDIYAQRMLAAGTPAWTVNGVAVCTETGAQINVQAVAESGGGVMLAWQDLRSGNYDIYAQRLDDSGSSVWAAGGVALCVEGTSQRLPLLVADGAGGAIVAWIDSRGGVSNFDLYAQRVSAAGAPQWAPDGVVVCAAPGNQSNLAVDSDASGGAVLTWQDARGGATPDIYAQRLTLTGQALWGANGTAVSTAAAEQQAPVIIPDRFGGAIIAWSDRRDGDDDVYAAQINSGGSLGGTVDAPLAGSLEALMLAPASPNPARAVTRLSFALAQGARVRLALYDAAGRHVRTLAEGEHAAGVHALSWDLSDAAGRPVGAGIYFARLEAAGRRDSRRVTVLP